MFNNNKLINNKKIAILATLFTLNINVVPINNNYQHVEAKNAVLDWNFYQYTESEPKASSDMDKTLEDAKKANADKKAKEQSDNNNSSNPSDISGPDNPNNLTGAGLDGNVNSNNKEGTGAGDYGENKELVRNILNGTHADKAIDIKTLGNNYGDTSADVDANQLAKAQEECLKATNNKDICTNNDVMNKYASCIKEYESADACAFLLDNTIENEEGLGSLIKKAFASQEGRENLAKYLGFNSWNDLLLEVGEEVAMTIVLSLATGGAGLAIRALMAARKGKKVLTAVEAAEKVAAKGSKLGEKLIDKANKINIGPNKIEKVEDVSSKMFKGSKEISTSNEKNIDEIKNLVNKSKDLNDTLQGNKTKAIESKITDLSRELTSTKDVNESKKITDMIEQLKIDKTELETKLNDEVFVTRTADELKELESSIDKSSRLLEKNDWKNNVVNKTIDAKNFVTDKVGNPLTNKYGIGVTSAVVSHETIYSDSALANASGINNPDAKVHNSEYNKMEANKQAVLKSRDNLIKENNDKIADYRNNVNEAMKVAQANNDEKTIKALDDEAVIINKVQNDANSKRGEIEKKAQETYDKLNEKQQTQNKYKRSISEYVKNGFK